VAFVPARLHFAGLKDGYNMSMLLQIHPESDLLKVFATGKFSLEDAKRTFLQMLEAIALHRCTKVFLDGRKLTGNAETMERFYYGEFAANMVMKASIEKGVSVGTQFAYVLSEPLLDPNRFGETVAVNRCMNVKTFRNPEEAHQWLKIAHANTPGGGEGNAAADSRG